MSRPPFETFKGATCKGSYALGTACGTCERCKWERGQLENNRIEPSSQADGFVEQPAPAQSYFGANWLREQIAEVCHDNQFDERFAELRKDGIERAIFLQVADALLAKFEIRPKFPPNQVRNDNGPALRPLTATDLGTIPLSPEFIVRKLKHTLCGIPIELNHEAPRDRIVLNPAVKAEIEQIAMRAGDVTVTYSFPKGVR